VGTMRMTKYITQANSSESIRVNYAPEPRQGLRRTVVRSAARAAASAASAPPGCSPRFAGAGGVTLRSEPGGRDSPTTSTL
jgi:hypothetical protein